MIKVRGLANKLVETPAADYEHIQTVKIGQRQHQMLRALAEYTGRSKTSLAADLLMAAVEDAIDSLPDEPVQGLVSDAEPVTVQAVVRGRGVELYELFLVEKHEDDDLPPVRSAIMRRLPRGNS
jgi:plasmid stabilization system protein ParE